MEQFINEVIQDLPDINQVDFTKINRDYFKVILINFFLYFIPLLITLIILDFYVFSDKVKAHEILIFACFFIFFGSVLLYIILMFPLRMYAIRDRDISYKCGLFFRKLTTVPFSRIQHVEIDEGPISRIFKLASISVYTAGDSSDDLIIKGIKREKALQIKEFISNKVNG